MNQLIVLQTVGAKGGRKLKVNAIKLNYAKIMKKPGSVTTVKNVNSHMEEQN